MRKFWEYEKHKNHRSEDTTAPMVQYYTRDFLDWYHDVRRFAPILSHKEWMTAYSACGHRAFRMSANRGIGNYLRARGHFPNFRDPEDFTQMTLMNSIIMPMPMQVPADKLLVGAQIPEHLSDQVRVAKVHKVFRKAADISLDGLPPGSYFLKSNHGSQQNIHLDLRPDATPPNVEELRERAGVWLSKAYGGNSSQWWYQLIERRVFIEEDLREDTSKPLEDLRFHVINGKVALLQLDIGLGTDARDNPVYDGDLNYLPYEFLRSNTAEAPLPKLAEKARDIAAELGHKYQYVRVDFYARGDELFLGELTFLPNSGRRKVRSAALNEILCSFWDPMPKVVDISVPAR